VSWHVEVSRKSFLTAEVVESAIDEPKRQEHLNVNEKFLIQTCFELKFLPDF